MENAKRKRGRPPKRKVMEFEGMTYEGAINNALDKEVQADLDKSLADKDESQLTDDERKYLKRKREKKSYTLNVRFTVLPSRPQLDRQANGKAPQHRPSLRSRGHRLCAEN